MAELLTLVIIAGYLMLVLSAGALGGFIGFWVGYVFGLLAYWLVSLFSPVSGGVEDIVFLLFLASGFCLGSVTGGVYAASWLSRMGPKRGMAASTDAPPALGSDGEAVPPPGDDEGYV